ncbi:hypothetical protein DCAR_0100875 [Daucus carota subsp. sativus]|uniref:Uncharacterized protein n=1 Tax=Daucus carota subsp. sativus TaxID=79200 RepID=A0AAF0W1Z1_DAUCS|nr:PREDICTED: uncharacterized protein LOC108217186 [Daucus carota subsp. sativus]WOG81724.1 hypothetical protein DCAR_0100875 [Daucus carota subsp. sativus]
MEFTSGRKRNLPGSTSPNASRISQRRRIVPTIPDESTNPPICDETVVKAQAGRDECATAKDPNWLEQREKKIMLIELGCCCFVSYIYMTPKLKIVGQIWYFLNCSFPSMYNCML